MSVYIKGMEMPTHCMDCPFMVSRDNDDCILQSDEANENFENWEQMKAGCPLIPVPEHGRLIDADALCQSIKESIAECQKWADAVEGGEMYARVSQSLGTFVECSLRVKAAPTIIPASGGNKNE